MVLKSSYKNTTVRANEAGPSNVRAKAIADAPIESMDGENRLKTGNPARAETLRRLRGSAFEDVRPRQSEKSAGEKQGEAVEQGRKPGRGDPASILKMLFE